MDYVTVSQARELAGLRLVLSVGVPAPWGEAAKQLCHAHGLAFTPVAQYPGESNDALAEWTGVRNAPVAVHGTEPPRTGWLEILMLTERLDTEGSLLPRDARLRAECIGIAHELCGEWGFGWCRRLMILGEMLGEAVEAGRERLPPGQARMLEEYRVTPTAIAAAPERVADIIGMLATRLHAQRIAGSDYLVGDTLSAADVYWACFSNMLEPLPAAHNPMPESLRALYGAPGETVAAAADPVVIEHRDRIFERHLRLPLDF